VKGLVVCVACVAGAWLSTSASLVSADPAAYGSSGCVASLVSYEQGPEPLKLSVPWLAAEPSEVGLVGYLFYYSRAISWGRLRVPDFRIYTGGKTPDGRRNMKILWTLSQGTAKQLRVQGKRLDRPGSFSQRIDPPLPGSNSSQFPSTINVPTAGCWRLTVNAGATVGRLTVRAVSGKKS
jgi:hypothetical protein